MVRRASITWCVGLFALCFSGLSMAAEKKEDEKVSVVIEKASSGKPGYYIMAEYDYFHSKIVSGKGLLTVKKVGERVPFVAMKAQIQQTASDSFGGIGESITGEWKNTKHPAVFKKLVCGQKVKLTYTLRDTKGMVAKFTTNKTVVKPSKARAELRKKWCPILKRQNLRKLPIRRVPKKRKLNPPPRP